MNATHSAEADAPETAVEISLRPVATTYAQAFLGAWQRAGQVAGLLAELNEFVTVVLPRVPGFEAMLTSGVVPLENKLRVLDRALAGQASPLVLDALKVLARHGRLDCLRQICKVARELWDKSEGRVRVQVTTAVPLDAAGRKRLVDSLRGWLRAEPMLGEHVDSDLIGGLVLRVGDQVVDGSVATQLEHLRTQMLNRSIHEIQSGRDRFSHPAGN